MDDISIETRGTTDWRPWLIVLLALLLAPRAIDEVIRAHVAAMLTRVPWHA